MHTNAHDASAIKRVCLIGVYIWLGIIYHPKQETPKLHTPVKPDTTRNPVLTELAEGLGTYDLREVSEADISVVDHRLSVAVSSTRHFTKLPFALELMRDSRAVEVLIIQDQRGADDLLLLLTTLTNEVEAPSNPSHELNHSQIHAQG